MDNHAENFTKQTAVDLETIFGPKRDTLYIVVPITVIYVTIFLSGIVGNVSTCVVIASSKSMHTATNFYLFSLAISDLLLLIFGLPPEIYSIWNRYPYVFGHTFCVLRGLVAETCANATVITIVAFTIERYVAICHPFVSHKMSNLSRVVWIIVFIWIVSVCCAIPQASQFGLFAVQGIEICHLVRPWIKYSFEISTVVFFVLPMFIITVLYALIGFSLKYSRMSGDGSGFIPAMRNKSHGKSSRRVLKMLVCVVIAFFVCWAPFHIQRLVAIYFPNMNNLKLYEVVTYISGVLYFLSATVNPLLYSLLSNKFRDAFKETFAKCCGFTVTPKKRYTFISRNPATGEASNSSRRTTLTYNESISSKRLSRTDSRHDKTNEGADIPLNALPKAPATNSTSSQKILAVPLPDSRGNRKNGFVRLFACIARSNLKIKKHASDAEFSKSDQICCSRRNDRIIEEEV